MLEESAFIKPESPPLAIKLSVGCVGVSSPYTMHIFVFKKTHFE